MSKRIARSTRQHVMFRDKSTCRFCGKPADTIDHLLPVSRGGSDLYANLVAACQPCNLRKRDRTPEQAGMHLLRPGTIVLVKGAEFFGD